MKLTRTLLLVFMVVVGCSSQAEEFALVVREEVKSELKLTLSELQAFPNSAVTVAEREGGSAKYAKKGIGTGGTSRR